MCGITCTDAEHEATGPVTARTESASLGDALGVALAIALPEGAATSVDEGATPTEAELEAELEAMATVLVEVDGLPSPPTGVGLSCGFWHASAVLDAAASPATTRAMVGSTRPLRLRALPSGRGRADGGEA
jgi:hypothetical protein